jgi:ABC-2 type transport system ATP-binding protein
VTQPLDPTAAISLRGLTKHYPSRGKAPAKLALDRVDLDVPRGTLFGLLGPNGAGKSTMINILGGLVRRSAGSALVWGHDIDRDMRRARAAIGIVPQELNIDPFFTPRALLDLHGGLYGVPKSARRTDAILAAVGLADKAEAYARTLSGGMRRRLMVAKALVHRPPVLVLDEPTAGVDIELRQQLWAYVRDLAAAGTTVLLTTHYLEEAESLCDRIAIIADGRVVANDSTAGLLQRIDAKSLTVAVDRLPVPTPSPLMDLGAESVADGRLRFRVRRDDPQVGRILAAIQACGLEIRDVATDEADLEDVFLQITRAARAESIGR